MVQNIVRKDENSSNYHIPKLFLKAFFLRLVESDDCMVKG